MFLFYVPNAGREIICSYLQHITNTKRDAVFGRLFVCSKLIFNDLQHSQPPASNRYPHAHNSDYEDLQRQSALRHIKHTVVARAVSQQRHRIQRQQIAVRRT